MPLIPSGGSSGGLQGFGPNRNRRKAEKLAKQPDKIPDGSGFNRLIQHRADMNNKPGPVNHFGDRIVGPARKNTQSARTGYGGRAFYGGNPRSGKTFRTGLTEKGQTVHLYASGERVVVPKKKAKFKY